MRHASKRAIRASIHASAREATRHLGRSRGSAGRFNPRLRTGGDQPCGTFGLYCGMFQSTPPHGRRHSPSGIQVASRRSFNPRLRTGGDRPTVILTVADIIVSIHASAREATEAFNSVGIVEGVSIHASAREATGQRAEADHPEKVFQSTPPHGRRPSLAACLFRAPPVSIHASAREATWAGLRDWLRAGGFNPRLRTGGDFTAGKVFAAIVRVSIHASAREATGRLGAGHGFLRKFQSTPPHGRRL